jgi:predicted transport protein
MAIFSITKDSAQKILPTKVDLERTVQKLFEKNLSIFLDIVFLASEYSTSFGGRIDTLGIDNNGAPVIIEYKRTQSDSVINQGLSYLRWLLDHKAEFGMLVQKADISIEVDWASPRVICIAESYNKFDVDTADLLPINIELYRYRMYENDLLWIEAEAKVKISAARLLAPGEQQTNNLFKDKISHTIEDHFKGTNKYTHELFLELKELILALDDDIVEEPKAKYIAYKLTTNFVDVVVLKDSLKIFLNIPSGQLKDPGGIARDLTKPQKIGHWGNGDYEIKFDRKESLEAIKELILQSYAYNK